MGFTQDLLFGKKYEKESEKFLVYETIEYAPDKKFSKYDFVTTLNGVVTKYEVKSDRLAYSTGNLAIEFMCNGVDSGVNATEADYYLYYVIKPDGYDLYKIPVEVLKKNLNGRIVNGGDGYRSRMSLVNIVNFYDYKFMIINGKGKEKENQ